MRRLDWNRYVPLGINGRKVRNGLLLVLGFGMLVSFGFLSRLFDARDELYEWVGRTRVLRPGAVMPDYPTLLRGTFWGLGAAAAGMIVLAAAFYACHYQGGRSIYTMRRLPKRWELWRRCLTLPVLTALACLILAVGLTLLYFEIYLQVTPEGCLPPEPWEGFRCWN